jgi:hypothetical protein
LADYEVTKHPIVRLSNSSSFRGPVVSYVNPLGFAALFWFHLKIESTPPWFILASIILEPEPGTRSLELAEAGTRLELANTATTLEEPP